MTNKRLKYYKDLIQQAKQKQGKLDTILNDKLTELQDETLIFERDQSDNDTKLHEQKQKKSDARKTIDDIDKNTEKY